MRRAYPTGYDSTIGGVKWNDGSLLMNSNVRRAEKVGMDDPKLSSKAVQSIADRFGVPWMINHEANKEGR